MFPAIKINREGGILLEWIDRIVITKDVVSKKPIIVCEGLWTGKDRMIINRHLVRYMRKAASDILKLHRQTDLKTQPEELKVIKELEELNKPEEVTVEYRDGTVETEVVEKAVKKENIKEEEIVKCPKTKPKKKKLLMRKKKG